MIGLGCGIKIATGDRNEKDRIFESVSLSALLLDVLSDLLAFYSKMVHRVCPDE